MSIREREHEKDQVGNLVPRDVVEVLAMERHSSKGKMRRKRGSSIRRAFSWLRRGRRGKNAHVSRNTDDLLGPGTPVPVPRPSPRAASKEDDVSVSVPQIFPENVFIEGNRHQYVENLHSEALQGLKLKQLEENNMSTDYQDGQSVISGVTSRDEGGSCSERRKSIGSESTATDTMSTVSTQSTISSRSTRSALSRQGSTFTPLNQMKKERTRGRRKHRRSTVMGIPRHVQKELGLDRAAWTAYQRSQEPVPTEDITDTPAIIGSTASAVDRPVSTSSRQQNAPSLQGQRPKDDLALIQSALPQGTSTQRPMSVAVPWATTAEAGNPLQNPPSPVMYISPQGMYLSKIIPNAVLPPSVDVVEFNRNRSRNSVRTVSKCSLASASPAPSRASSRASSRVSSRASSQRSVLCSESSGWSRSDSSETLVSDSSTISSSSTARATSSGKESVVDARPFKADARPNGQVRVVEERDQTTGQFTRSLSVMKRAKKPPPPSRSYSLHKDKMKRRSRDLAEAKIDLSGVMPKGGRQRTAGGSPGYSADESAVEESFSSGAASPPNTQQQTSAIENGLKRTLSPSSGYSSHNGTPNTKEAHLHSAGDQTHAKSELTAVPSNHVKPAVLALKALFEIPQPPKVTAPPPPPPETWTHNQRTFVLLCGPGPANIKFASPPKRLQAQHGKGEVNSAKIPSSLSVEQRQHTTTLTAEQDSPSINKRSSPLPHNRNLMQELQKVQQSPSMNRSPMKASPENRNLSQMASSEKQVGPPLSPPLPPPPPPLEMPLDSLTPLDEVDLPPPPPLFSPNARICQGIPPGIPPPPQQPPPPPPQHPPPPPPVAVPLSKKDVSPAPPAHAHPDIPKAPPLPVNIKTQPSPLTSIKLRKVPPPQKKDPPTSNDDSSSPVVTPSILQKVRLRSIKSTPKPVQNVTEVKTVEQTDQKPAIGQVPPPKPIRRSLLLAEPPPDVAALIADEPKSVPDMSKQMSKTEATPPKSQSEVTVLNSQSEPPAETSQPDSTIPDSHPDATDLKSLPGPIASVPQPEPTKLASQLEPTIPDSKTEQSKAQLEQSISIPDPQPAVKCETEPAVLKSDPEPPSVSSQPDSTIPDSQPDATDLKSLPIVSVPQPKPTELASRPEPAIPNSQKEQSNIQLEQSIIVPDQQPAAKSEPEQAELKPELDSAALISELDQTTETSPPEPPVADSQLKPAISETEKPDHDTSEGAPEQVAPNYKALEVVSESKPEAEASVAQTEQASETESTVSKSDPETTSVTSQLQPNVPPSVSEPSVSKSDPDPGDAPEPDAAESKPELPLESSKSEPEPAISKSEPELVVSSESVEVLGATVESNPGLETVVSKPESITTAAVSQSTTTIATASESQPTITVTTSQAISTAPKTQTNKPTSPKSPTIKSPPVSVNSPSMRLQEAIRQRTAAMSANDGHAKRLSLHSPPATLGGSLLKSPTSTANFIFAKSNKKVITETPTSPEVQSSLGGTVQTEVATASCQFKQGEEQKQSVKVPPPVANKPRAKMQSQRNGLPNPSTEGAVAAEVQTAGQGAQSDDTRNIA